MKSLWLGRAGAEAVRIPADSLVTHAVCVGMTGSGKTGLCIALLEEVAAAGVPIFAIDPKGDLANLAITLPDEDAAVGWREGQATWGIDQAEVADWRGRVHPRIYTPGSDAGLGIDVLGALRRPTGDLDAETRRQLVTGTVTALLGLVGVAADPMLSPAHVVLSRILDDAWSRGEDPDLVALLTQLVQPPFDRIGVFPTDTFFPPDKRLSLAMHFNALVASPAFGAWSLGEPLDLAAMAAPVDGCAPINVFSIAHLTDAERHFFVGILLDRLLAWSRTLAGTSSLRALLFFDEVWGFLPPHPHDPPAKRPLLGLLKQARAVGIGVALATQNPVDLDYKALSNAGTWFVGRLQTRNDRDRVRDGLTGAGMLSEQVETLLDQLASRRFLLHRSGHVPLIFDTRWTRVYLSGPVSRARLKTLNPPVRASVRPMPARPAQLPAWPGPQWVLAEAALPKLGLGRGPTHLPALLVEVRAGDRVESRVFFPLVEGFPDAPHRATLGPADLAEDPPRDASFAGLPDWLDDLREVERAARVVLAEVVAERQDAKARLGADRAARKQRVAAETKVRRLEEKVERLSVSASGRQTEEILHAGEAVLSLFVGRRKTFASLASKRRQVNEADTRLDAAQAELVEARAAVERIESELSALGEPVAATSAPPRVVRQGLLWVPTDGMG